MNIKLLRQGGLRINTYGIDVLNAILLLLRFGQPFFLIFILYMAFTSMRKNKLDGSSVINLVNVITGETIPVIYWENSIGRSKLSDIVVSDITVSRNHAVLYRRDAGWIVSDCGSKSGVKVKGKKIKGSTVVNLGDTITVGNTPLILKESNQIYERKRSWFFNMKKNRGTLSAFTLMLLVNIFHFQLMLQLSLSEGNLDLKYLNPFLAIFAAGWLFFIASMFIFKRTTFELEIIAILLSGIGLIAIGSVSYRNFMAQIAAMILAMAGFLFFLWFMEFPGRVMEYRLIISAGTIALLILTLIIGSSINGSRSWIIIGPVSFQASELAKVGLILVGTSTLAKLQTTKNMTEFIIFACICIGIMCLMKDFGTVSIFFVTFIIVAIMRSGEIRTIVFIISAAVLGSFIVYKLMPHIVRRFSTWGHVWEEINDRGYQQTRMLSYSASGGLFGLGVGKGELKTVFAASNDLVFGVLCEEMGIIIAITVAATIAAIAYYSRLITKSSRSTLYSIAACSAGGLLVFQAALNIFGSTDILPFTGVTLPFISSGGSSLISVWLLLAFIKAADERTYSQRR